MMLGLTGVRDERRDIRVALRVADCRREVFRGDFFAGDW